VIDYFKFDDFLKEAEAPLVDANLVKREASSSSISRSIALPV
jgi:hypothetical protein